MEPKISLFIIALILISLSSGIFGIFMSDISAEYDLNDYDNNTIEAYNHLDEIRRDSQDIQNATLGIKERAGITDIVGNYISGAYSALKITFGSFNIFDSMSNQAFSTLPLGAGGGMIRTSLVTIVLVLITISIGLSALIKKVL